MPTFKEVLRAAQVTVQDKTSGRRMREMSRRYCANIRAYLPGSLPKRRRPSSRIWAPRS